MPRKSRRSNSEILINEYDDGKSLFQSPNTLTPPHQSEDISAIQNGEPTRTGASAAIEADSAKPLIVNNKPLPVPSPPVFNPNVAPDKDFNKRANSLERHALPSGLFPGSSKKLYDALYLRTRGAIQPVLSIKATNRDLMKWTGIRNIKTVRTQIINLAAAGLITRTRINGDPSGYIYEVRLPEEASKTDVLTPTSTSTSTPTNLDSYQYQKLVGVGRGKLIENKGTYNFPKTIHKTNTIDDDARASFASLAEALAAAARDLTGSFAMAAIETEKWGEVGRVLATELKSAASRTGTISSVPAFLTAHLKRCFAKAATFPQVEPDSIPSTPADSSEAPAVQSLSAEEVEEYTGFITDLLANGYTTEQASTQFATCFHATDWHTILSAAETRIQSRIASPGGNRVAANTRIDNE